MLWQRRAHQLTHYHCVNSPTASIPTTTHTSSWSTIQPLRDARTLDPGHARVLRNGLNLPRCVGAGADSVNRRPPVRARMTNQDLAPPLIARRHRLLSSRASDYKHRAQKRPPAKPLPVWLWLLTGLLLGGLSWAWCG